MDLLSFDPCYAVWACVPCRYAIVPDSILAHLRGYRKDEVTPRQARECVEACLARPACRPELVQRLEISPLIPYLQLYLDGIACRLCQPLSQPYICRSERSMRVHLKQTHKWQSSNKGGSPQRAIHTQFINA
ncbi:hypothetical protein VE00_10610 [Pseudogymnoascus sp. WSF 3629]|nr:hypothetical protein VE00_10610 [Pseudogymnoascus sp. WSF 3629]